jgi:hypothetical protein
MAGRQAPTRERCWWATGFVALALGCLGQGPLAAAPRYAQTPLRELPLTASLSNENVTLEGLARKWAGAAGGQSARFLLVYLWVASADYQPIVQPQVLAELSELDQYRWDIWGKREDQRTAVISVVHVYAGSDAEAERVYRAIQQSGRSRWQIPTFVDVKGQLSAAVTEAVHVRRLVMPFVFLVSASDLTIKASRADDPVSAYVWLSTVFAEQQGANPGDPPDIPAGCEQSWFRRSLARVARVGLLEAQSAPLDPAADVSDVEFVGWLTRLSPQRAAGALSELDRASPSPLTRERAITATVRFLYGQDARTALADCAPPVGEAGYRQGGDVAAQWEQSFARLRGSESVTPALRPYLALALAKGLLYSQPSLHAQSNTSREVAAWLLAHALGQPQDSVTGLIVDAVDVPLEPDLVSGEGEIRVEVGGSAPPIALYSSASRASERTPTVAPGYPAVLHLPYQAFADKESVQAKWLRARVGDNPLVVRPLRTLGQGLNARKVVVSAEDGARLRELNKETGLLDGWRVAFLYGVGAQLTTATQAPLPRNSFLTIRFSCPMDPSTITPDTVWLQSSDGQQRVPARLSWTLQNRELVVQPEATLAPGAGYELVVGASARSQQGEPLTLRPSESLPASISRRWSFTTENLVRAYITVVGAADGSKLYLPGKADPVLLPSPTPTELVTPPGTVSLRLERPDGGVQALTAEVTSDGLVQVQAEVPRPARLVLEGLPSQPLRPGEIATVKVRATDASGAPLRFHVPALVSVAAVGGQVSPSGEVTVADGEATLTISADRPGRMVVSVTPADQTAMVVGSPAVIYCQYAPAALRTLVSVTERHTLPPARRGEVEVQAMPRFRRWLARDPQAEVQVADQRGTYRQVPASRRLLANREFYVDQAGCLCFHASAGGRPVTVSYQYRPGRCAVVVTGLSRGDPAARELEALVSDFASELGYECVSSSELAGLWEEADSQADMQSDAEVRLAMDIFGLDELFVAELVPREGNLYALGWTMWSREPIGLVRWSSAAQGVAPVPVQVDRSRAVPINASFLKEAIPRSLRDWLGPRGMGLSRTLRDQERR